MPFRGRSVMDEREEFCRLALRPGANVRALCRGWGISPDRAYVWIGRFEAAGREGLADRSRRPLTSPQRSASELEDQVLAVRAEHPTWGGRKIRRVLNDEGVSPPPAASTITEILRRHGQLDGPRAGQARDYIRFEHARPNELWQMDFKGHFALARGRCHPLTVLDDHSRYAMAVQACADEQSATVKDRLTKVFERYGLPLRILCDNGSPWGAAGGDVRHTRLTVWLLDLVIGARTTRRPRARTSASTARSKRTFSTAPSCPTWPPHKAPSTPGERSTTPAGPTRRWAWISRPAATSPAPGPCRPSSSPPSTRPAHMCAKSSRAAGSPSRDACTDGPGPSSARPSRFDLPTPMASSTSATDAIASRKSTCERR